MLKYVIFTFILLIGVRSSAQEYNRFLHKKFEVKQQQKNTTTLFAQGEEILFYSDKTIQSFCTVIEVSPKGFQLQINTQSVTGQLNAFGQEQHFSTTDQSALAPADSAAIQSLLNKVQLVKVQNHQQIFVSDNNNDTSKGNVFVVPDDVTKYFLALPATALKLGYSWVDSTEVDSSKTVNQYIISKIDADSLQVTVFSTLQQRTIVKQQNQQMIQQLKGYAKAERWYDLKQRILKQELLNTTFNGMSGINSESLPISIKINTQTFLRPIH